MAPPISIKLRCNSWRQLAALYKRDLRRSAVFLKSSAPPPLETPVRINLTLPDQELVVLSGVVEQHIPPGGLNGRGPGVDIKLVQIPDDAMAKIQAALDRGPGDAQTGTEEDSGASKPAETPKPAATEAAPAESPNADADAPAPAPAERPAATPPPIPPNVRRAATPPPIPVQARKPPPPPPPEEDIAAIDPLDEDILPIDDEIDETPPPSPAEGNGELVARLEQERESLRKLNPFQILGVGYETTDEAVHEAFASLSQRYHPDHFAEGSDPAAKQIAADIFGLVRDAHRMLGSAAARMRVRNQIEGTDEAAPEAPPQEEAPADDEGLTLAPAGESEPPATDETSEPAAAEAAPAEAAPAEVIDLEDSDSAPSEPQEEIPTKPVMVDEGGMPMKVDNQGVPVEPQEELPTKPAPVADDAPASPAADAAEAPAEPPAAEAAEPPAADAQDAAPVAEEAPASEAAASGPAEGIQGFDEDPLATDDGVEEAPSAAQPETDAAAASASAADLGLAGEDRFAEAITHLDEGRYKEAASVYRAAKRRDPGDLGARVGFELTEGLRFMEMRDRLEAGQRFEAVLEMDPENVRAKSELAEIRRQVAEERRAALSRLRDQQD